jgi:hypothetical protein
MHEHQRQVFGLISGVLPRHCSLFRAISHSLDAPFPLMSQQEVSRHVQIRQGAGGEQAVRILHESPLLSKTAETSGVMS